MYIIETEPFRIPMTDQSMDDLRNRGAADRSNHVIVICNHG